MKFCASTQEFAIVLLSLSTYFPWQALFLEVGGGAPIKPKCKFVSRGQHQTIVAKPSAQPENRNGGLFWGSGGRAPSRWRPMGVWRRSPKPPEARGFKILQFCRSKSFKSFAKVLK